MASTNSNVGEASRLSSKKLTRETRPLPVCHDCGAAPGQPHRTGCDVERCSVCGGQRLGCSCRGHDPKFARWSGIWPGTAEAAHLGIDLNEFYRRGFDQIFFVKPRS